MAPTKWIIAPVEDNGTDLTACGAIAWRAFGNTQSKAFLWLSSFSTNRQATAKADCVRRGNFNTHA